MSAAVQSCPAEPVACIEHESVSSSLYNHIAIMRISATISGVITVHTSWHASAGPTAGAGANYAKSHLFSMDVLDLMAATQLMHLASRSFMSDPHSACRDAMILSSAAQA